LRQFSARLTPFSPRMASVSPRRFIWIPVVGNILAVLIIPFVGELSDRIGRRLPIIIGALGSGLLAFAYLYAVSIKKVPLAIAMSLLMWGMFYQG
jgi:MFS family permease